MKEKEREKKKTKYMGYILCGVFLTGAGIYGVYELGYVIGKFIGLFLH